MKKCGDCGEGDCVTGRKHCRSCLDKRSDYSRRYYENHKEQCLMANKKRKKISVESSRSRARAYRKANPEKHNEWNRRYRATEKGRACHWRSMLKCKYVLTVEQYENMIMRQKGLCAICGMKMEKPFVDHDHKTGLVRALLCIQCNGVIGHARDNVVILKRAIDYLTAHSIDRIAPRLYG